MKPMTAKDIKLINEGVDRIRTSKTILSEANSKWAEQVGDRATRIANLYLGCV